MPVEKLIESGNKSRTDEPSWLDFFSRAYQGDFNGAYKASIDFQKVWMPWNTLLAFQHDAGYKQIESPWSHATTLQIAHVVGMRHYLVAHKRQIEKAAHRRTGAIDLTTLFAKHHVGLNTLPGSRELVENCLNLFKPYGIMGRTADRQGQIAYPFGEPINLEDLAWQGAFQGTPEVRRDCGFINFEHCVFNTRENSYAPLQRCDLRDANLRRADLQWCDLSGSDFCGADLRGANLKNAKLDDVLYDNTTLIDADTKLPSSFKAHLVTRVDKERGDVFGYMDQHGFQTSLTDPLFPKMREKALSPTNVLAEGSGKVGAHEVVKVDFRKRA